MNIFGSNKQRRNCQPFFKFCGASAQGWDQVMLLPIVVKAASDQEHIHEIRNGLSNPELVIFRYFHREDGQLVTREQTLREGPRSCKHNGPTLIRIGNLSRRYSTKSTKVYIGAKV